LPRRAASAKKEMLATIRPAFDAAGSCDSAVVLLISNNDPHHWRGSPGVGCRDWFAVPEPRRGGLMVAQGKGAQRLPPWVTGHPTQLLFPLRFGAPAARQTAREKGNCFGPATQGGARSSLALGYHHIVPTGLQFGSLRSHLPTF